MRDWEGWVRAHLALTDLSTARERRIVRELATQLEDVYREAKGRGLDDASAEATAAAQVPDWQAMARDIRAADRRHVQARVQRWVTRAESRAYTCGGRWRVLGDLLLDTRHAVRNLRRQPGYATIAILTLALGIGATTAIFSAVHAVLLRPLPYPNPEQLAVISLAWPEGRFWLSERDVLELRERASLFEGFAVLDEGTTTLLGDQGPQRLQVGLVSSNLFSLLEVQPALGRLFRPEDELPNGPPVVVLSHELWQSRFGADPAVIGRVLPLDGTRRALRAIGVLPRGFEVVMPAHTNFHSRVDLWHPHQVDYRTVDRGRNLAVLGRVKSGVTWPQAQQDLDRIARGVFTADGDTRTFRAFPLHDDIVRDYRAALVTLLVATLAVLLIACTNIASLLLARGVSRTQEFAIRAGLGASRGRLIRQSLTESAVLSVGGGAGGLLLAWGGIGSLGWLLPADLPRLETVVLDGTVLAVAAVLSLATGLAFGALPALRTAPGNVERLLRLGRQGQDTGAASPRLRSALVAGQIALASMLLVVGSLTLRSFVELRRTDLGFDASNTLAFTVALPTSRYPDASQRNRLFEGLQRRLGGLPGVESVGGNLILPFGPSLFQTSFTFYGSEASTAGDHPVRLALARPALPGYFETLRTPLVEGRFFTPRDNEQGPRVAIIDVTLARSLWPDASALGKRLARGGNPAQPDYYEVVGVVENLRLTRLTGERLGQVFLPVAQFPVSTLSFVVRTRVPPETLLGPVTAEVHALDPRLPLYDVDRLDRVVADVMAPQRLTALFLGLFGSAGLLLAALGVYGIISYSVNQRRQEFGVRTALGAQPSAIWRSVLGQGLRVTGLGLAIGTAGALALSRTVESLIDGVSASNPATYAGVAIVLRSTALVACLAPARRAGRVDPMQVLRHE